MTSAIDPTVIGSGNVDKAAVRLQLERARDEITDLQDDKLDKSGGTMTGALILDVPLAVAEGGTGADNAATARTNLGATTVGGAVFTAANEAAARTAIASPAIPTVSSGVAGEFIYVNTASGAGYTLPAGGTWLFYLNLIVTATAANTGTQACGIQPGGTLVAGASASNQWQGFVWRIA